MAANDDLAMEVHAGARHPATVNRGNRLGGTEGNQILTSSVAGILTVYDR